MGSTNMSPSPSQLVISSFFGRLAGMPLIQLAFLSAVSDTSYPNVRVEGNVQDGAEQIWFHDWETEDQAIFLGVLVCCMIALARMKSKARDSLYELAARRERRWEERVRQLCALSYTVCDL